MLPALTFAARDALARRHFPDGMAFEAEYEELLRRGYPFLRVLTEGTDEDKKAVKIAEKHFKAIDPTRGVRWLREAARRYVHLYAASPSDAGEVDVATLDRLLSDKLRDNIGYGFHFNDAIWLTEAFLGPRVVAERLIAALATVPPEGKNAAHDRPTFKAIDAIFCLELAVLRADDPELNERAEALLREMAPRFPDHVLGTRIALTLEGPPPKPGLLYSVGFLWTDPAFLPKYLEDLYYAPSLITPQLVRVGGPDWATPAILARMRRGSASDVKECCEIFGVIKHPFVVEMFAGMLGSKGAAGAPEGWLVDHLDFARPTLERLVASKHPNAALIAGILSSDPRAAAPPKKMTKKELDRVVTAGFSRIKKELPKVKGDAAGERTLIREVVHAIVEARAAAGEVLPDAQVGHILMLDGWGKLAPPLGEGLTEEEIARYGTMIDEASSS